MGLGTAYIFAAEKVQGDFIIITDGDMSFHPDYMGPMIEEQIRGDFDIVSGSRYKSGGGVAGWDWKRRFCSSGGNLLSRILLNPFTISDMTGSFRIYKKSVFMTLIGKVKSFGYSFQMEIIFRALMSGFSVSVIPVVFVDRLYGESKLGTQEISSFAKVLMALYKEKWFG